MTLTARASLAALLAFGLGALGCSSDKTAAKGAKTAADAKTAGAPAPADAARAEARPAEGGVASPGLHVSDEIARACALPKVDYAPTFDLDSAAIGPEDKNLLSAVARCVSEGALRGRRLSLVGRADPRGEDEYNMALGGTRADSVKRYLKDLGVDEGRVSATSRGELDATGTDEAGWERDRRVDIQLAN